MECEKVLLRYGEIIYDHTTTTRTRLIKLDKDFYILIMKDGEVVECRKLKEEF